LAIKFEHLARVFEHVEIKEYCTEDGGLGRLEFPNSIADKVFSYASKFGTLIFPN